MREEIIKCFVRDTEFKVNLFGRPKENCSKSCTDFKKYWNAMLSSLEGITLSTESSKRLRGDLFRLANELKQQEAK